MRDGTRIDLAQVLDYVADAKGTFGKEDDPLGYVAAVLEDVPLLVAELWAAREVVEAAGPVILNPHDLARLRRLHEKRNAYDQVMGS